MKNLAKNIQNFNLFIYMHYHPIDISDIRKKGWTHYRWVPPTFKFNGGFLFINKADQKLIYWQNVDINALNSTIDNNNTSCKTISGMGFTQKKTTVPEGTPFGWCHDSKSWFFFYNKNVFIAPMTNEIFRSNNGEYKFNFTNDELESLVKQTEFNHVDIQEISKQGWIYYKWIPSVYDYGKNQVVKPSGFLFSNKEKKIKWVSNFSQNNGGMGTIIKVSGKTQRSLCSANITGIGFTTVAITLVDNKSIIPAGTPFGWCHTGKAWVFYSNNEIYFAPLTSAIINAAFENESCDESCNEQNEIIYSKESYYPVTNKLKNFNFSHYKWVPPKKEKQQNSGFIFVKEDIETFFHVKFDDLISNLIRIDNNSSGIELCSISDNEKGITTSEYKQYIPNIPIGTTFGWCNNLYGWLFYFNDAVFLGQLVEEKLIALLNAHSGKKGEFKIANWDNTGVYIDNKLYDIEINDVLENLQLIDTLPSTCKPRARITQNKTKQIINYNHITIKKNTEYHWCFEPTGLIFIETSSYNPQYYLGTIDMKKLVTMINNYDEKNNDETYSYDNRNHNRDRDRKDFSTTIHGPPKGDSTKLLRPTRH